MPIRSGTLVLTLIFASQFSFAEEYLVLTTGKKYLGKVSGADKTKFIFCDAKVGSIPDGSKLETTLEKCGGQLVMSIPFDSSRFRLLAISEGAAQENNQSLAKDALKAAVQLQDFKGERSEQKAKAAVDKMEAEAGSRLQIYVDKGQAAFTAIQVKRP